MKPAQTMTSEVMECKRDQRNTRNSGTGKNLCDQLKSDDDDKVGIAKC
jgi:hypothetical protein